MAPFKCREPNITGMLHKYEGLLQSPPHPSQLNLSIIHSDALHQF